MRTSLSFKMLVVVWIICAAVSGLSLHSRYVRIYEHSTLSSVSRSSGSQSDTDRWKSQNPQLAPILSECYPYINQSVVANNVPSSFSGLAIIGVNHGLGFAYDIQNQQALRGVSCVGESIGYHDPSQLAGSIAELGASNSGAPAGDITETTTPQDAGHGIRVYCQIDQNINFCTLKSPE